MVTVIPGTSCRCNCNALDQQSEIGGRFVPLCTDLCITLDIIKPTSELRSQICELLNHHNRLFSENLAPEDEAAAVEFRVTFEQFFNRALYRS